MRVYCQLSIAKSGLRFMPVQLIWAHSPLSGTNDKGQELKNKVPYSNARLKLDPSARCIQQAIILSEALSRTFVATEAIEKICLSGYVNIILVSGFYIEFMYIIQASPYRCHRNYSSLDRIES